MFLDYQTHRVAFECKFANVPRSSRAFYNAAEDVAPERVWMVTPETERFERSDWAPVCRLLDVNVAERDAGWAIVDTWPNYVIRGS